MPLQFHRVIEEMEIWSAKSDGYSFAISFFKTFSGPGFHERPGYVASWRPLYGDRGAIKIIGSPFKSFDEAEAACDAMLRNLISEGQPVEPPNSYGPPINQSTAMRSIGLPASLARR
jgi:hypothetical protein